MVHIFSDSTSDLSPELLERFGVRIIPLSVFIAGKTYQDRVDITPQQLFDLVETQKQLPKTSAPAVSEFIHLFDTPSGDNIYIGISSKLSGTVQNAILAAQAPEGARTRVIDSLNLSTGIGLLVLRAAEAAQNGCTAAQIENDILATVPKVRTSFVIDTLEYLHKGGRCTTLQSIASSLLKIRPVIEVRPDGTLGIKDKVRGSRSKALQSMLDDFKKNLPKIDPHRVFITHTGCDADAEFLQSEIQKMLPAAEVCITTAGSVIASHCGPDTIGI
ncbi:MAG TPA: DegV family protein, partial [Anaerolineaceae bacterium]|nr:DegV family protein [Anaerolineaceae bacterium]